MKIQILGMGCPKCKKLEEAAVKALEETGINGVIEKVTDSEEIMNMGVMMTPALAVDGDVKSSGKLLSPEEIAEILRKG